jgi:cytochrome oxidase assembly protein ShyY1
MYRFARRPKWIALHVFVLGVVVTCALAGIWQLSRLSDRRERNDQIQQAVQGPEKDISDFVLVSGRDYFENVRAEGRYDTKNEVILRSRSLNGRPGNHVLTPLLIDGGLAVIIDRGWVPAELDEAPVAEASPPEGKVTVHGLMVDAEPQRPLQPDDPGSGRLTSVRRVNPVRLSAQMPYPLLPTYIQLRAQDPQPGELPRIVAEPELSDGPHLAYAVQWFIFLVIALTVYVVLLRREARRLVKEAAAP